MRLIQDANLIKPYAGCSREHPACCLQRTVLRTADDVPQNIAAEAG